MLALALGLRLEAALTPIRDPGTDSITYAALAEGLYERGRYEGEGVSRPSDWSPGTPFFIAGVYALTGGVDQEVGLAAVALVGTGLVLLVYLLGRRLAGPGRAGVVAGLLGALLAAVYPSFLDGTGRFLSEPLAGFLLVAALLTLLRAIEDGRLALWAAAGGLLGLLAFTRAEYLAVGLVLCLLGAIVFARRSGRRGGLIRGAAAVAAMTCALLPWAVRNQIVLDRPVPVSTGGGKALFIGTYLPGEGQNTPTKERLIERYGGRETDMEALLARVAARYPELDRDRALARIGRENLRRYAGDEPAEYARMLVEKAGLVWYRGSSPSAAPAGWVWLHRGALVLALVGLAVLALRQRAEVVLLGAPLVLVTALGALLLAVPRRNVPLMPLVLALGAMGAVWLLLEARARIRARAEAGGASSATAAGADSTTPIA